VERPADGNGGGFEGSGRDRALGQSAQLSRRCEWFTCVEEIPEADRLRMIEFAQLELGKIRKVEGSVARPEDPFSEGQGAARRLRRERQFFCSHYVAAVYNAVGKDLKKGVSDRFMSPEDVAGSPLLKRAGVLRKTIARAT